MLVGAKWMLAVRGGGDSPLNRGADCEASPRVNQKATCSLTCLHGAHLTFFFRFSSRIVCGLINHLNLLAGIFSFALRRAFYCTSRYWLTMDFMHSASTGAANTPISNDAMFGPQFGQAFDFTMVFSNTILSILPSVVMIIAGIVYFFWYRKLAAVTSNRSLLWTKLVSVTCPAFASDALHVLKFFFSRLLWAA